MFKFESLGVYQEANNFVIATYTLLKKFPLEERYALCDQMIAKMLSGLRKYILTPKPSKL